MERSDGQDQRGEGTDPLWDAEAEGNILSMRSPEETEVLLREVKEIREAVYQPLTTWQKCRRVLIACAVWLFVSFFFNFWPWTIRSACPVCHSRTDHVPIVYGLILGSGRDEEGNYKYWPGGCDFSLHNPDRHCIKCGTEWRSPRRELLSALEIYLLG